VEKQPGEKVAYNTENKINIIKIFY